VRSHGKRGASCIEHAPISGRENYCVRELAIYAAAGTDARRASHAAISSVPRCACVAQTRSSRDLFNRIITSFEFSFLA
jgi:hypothetical protein